MEDLKNKKFAIVLGGGVDGCGVTRACIEIQNWCNKNDIFVKIYSFDEYNFGTAKSQKIEYTSFKNEDIPNTLDEINKFDVVMFHSFPSKKYSHNSINNFYEFIKKISITKVTFMHAVTRNSINITPNIVMLINQMDLIYSFSLSSFFSQKTIEMIPSKKNRIKKLNLWFDFDNLNKYKSIPLQERNNKKLLYVGRFATFKNTERTLYLGKELKDLDNDFVTEMHGLYPTIATKINIFDNPYCINRTNKKSIPGPEAFIECFGEYKYEDAMEMLSKSLFACSFFSLPDNPENYGDRMEYTQMEMIGCGCIPIFDKHWSENNHTLDGKLYKDIPYFGLYANKDNLKEIAEKMLEISNNPELAQKYIDTSYKTVKENFDVNKIMPAMLKDMITIGIEDKVSDDDLLQRITNSDDFIETYNQQTEEGKVVVTNYSTLPGNVLFVLDGKKKEKVKNCKKNK